jgi:hypothetical protein
MTAETAVIGARRGGPCWRPDRRRSAPPGRPRLRGLPQPQLERGGQLAGGGAEPDHAEGRHPGGEQQLVIVDVLAVRRVTRHHDRYVPVPSRLGDAGRPAVGDHDPGPGHGVGQTVVLEERGGARDRRGTAAAVLHDHRRAFAARRVPAFQPIHQPVEAMPVGPHDRQHIEPRRTAGHISFPTTVASG